MIANDGKTRAGFTFSEFMTLTLGLFFIGLAMGSFITWMLMKS